MAHGNASGTPVARTAVLRQANSNLRLAGIVAGVLMNCCADGPDLLPVLGRGVATLGGDTNAAARRSATFVQLLARPLGALGKHTAPPESPATGTTTPSSGTSAKVTRVVERCAQALHSCCVNNEDGAVGARNAAICARAGVAPAAAACLSAIQRRQAAVSGAFEEALSALARLAQGQGAGEDDAQAAAGDGAQAGEQQQATAGDGGETSRRSSTKERQQTTPRRHSASSGSNNGSRQRSQNARPSRGKGAARGATKALKAVASGSQQAPSAVAAARRSVNGALSPVAVQAGSTVPTGGAAHTSQHKSSSTPAARKQRSRGAGSRGRDSPRARATRSLGKTHKAGGVVSPR